MLQQSPDLFEYSITGLLSDYSRDRLSQINNTYQLGTRAWGATEMLLGGALDF